MDICPRVLVYEKGHFVFVSVALLPSPRVVMTHVLSGSKPCPRIHPRERSAFPNASQPLRKMGPLVPGCIGCCSPASGRQRGPDCSRAPGSAWRPVS